MVRLQEREAQMKTRPVCVQVQHDPPPVPLRNCDWCAWVDGQEEAQQYGYGATRADAVRALYERLEEESDIEMAIRTVGDFRGEVE
jgi:hypothetical protein